MKKIKDNFSKQAQLYKTFRPNYPDELINYILDLVPEKKVAWDCGTGNGQVAMALAKDFKQVIATDISENQINQAEKKSNIMYKICRAEKSGLPDKYVDLITVAQAIHWFDFDVFYKEVKRVLKSSGIITVWGYGLCEIDHEIDGLINHFYNEIIGTYWDEERKLLDNRYETISFPFTKISSYGKEFIMEKNWTLKEFEGYLNTWSAVQKFIKNNQYNPIDELIEKISQFWSFKDKKKVVWPLFVKMGKLS